MDEVTIRVLALAHVLGMWAGTEHDVYPSPRVEKLLSSGHLVWLDEPNDGYERQWEGE